MVSPGLAVLNVTQKPSERITMVGIEHGHGLYEVVVSTGSVTVNLVQSVESLFWHRRFDH